MPELSPTVAMPRLSVDLPGPRHPERCQNCGAGPLPGMDEPGADLFRWLEHDERDLPEPVLVLLCRPCEKKIIEPHPRLYAAVDAWRPWPGAMPLCTDCRFRDGLNCKHPDLRANGGPGLELIFPKPSQIHVLTSPRRNSGWKTVYFGPVQSCAGRQVEEGDPS